MENTVGSPTPDEAAATLAEAEAARTKLAAELRLPSFFLASIATVIAVQIATTALGIAQVADWSGMVLVAGLAAFVLVGTVQLVRFRRLNGLWLGGFASRVVGGTGMAASTSYALALAAAIWASFDRAWWLVALCSVAGGVAYGLSGRRWVRTYRADPARHGRGESLAWLAVLSAVAVAGLALLLNGH